MTYNPMSKEFQDECKKLGLTGRQLTEKYRKEGKGIEKGKYKNKTCCICNSQDTYITTNGWKQWHKHKCQKTVCTKYLCEHCYKIHDPKSINNLFKLITNSRTGNQNINSARWLGDMSQKLACMLYGWEDLNKKYDNYRTPIDCFDPKTGLYHQVQGHCYSSIYRRWMVNHFEREYGKKYENMVCFCFDKYVKTIERIYKFPDNIVKNKNSVTIIKNPSIGYPWYEEYRITDKEELKRANDIWSDINGRD